MSRYFLAIFAALCVLAGVSFAAASARPHPTPTPSPSPTPVADPAVTLIANRQFVAWQAGKLNKSLYAPEVLAKLTDSKIDDTSHALGTLGALDHTIFMGPFMAPDIPADAHGYIYQMQCEAGVVYEWLVLDGQGKIATIYFKDKLTTEEVEVPASPAPSPTS